MNWKSVSTQLENPRGLGLAAVGSRELALLRETVAACRFVVMGFRGNTTKPPKYHRKSLYFVKDCTVCTLCRIHPNPFHSKGFELKRLVYSGVFPSWTSRVRIPSPALNWTFAISQPALER